MQVTKIEATSQNKTITRYAAYARVSSSSEEQLQSFASQLRYYNTMFENKTDSVLIEMYADEGITGTDVTKREDFKRMMADAAKHKFDRVICKSVTRFARNTKDCLAAIRKLKALGISVYFEENSIDTTNMSGEVLVTLLGLAAQHESVSISKNVKWGCQKRMQEGTFITPSAPFGYDYIEQKMVINERDSGIVRKIYADYLSGKGIDSIAYELKQTTGDAWNYTKVRYILTNDKYTGNSTFQKRYTTETLPFRKMMNNGEFPKYYVTDTHDAIISQDDFDKVQNLMAKRRLDSKKSEIYPLSQKIVCGECGHKFRRIEYRNRVSWVCRTHHNNSKDCSLKPVPEYTIYEAFIRLFNKLKINCKVILTPVIGQLEKLSATQKIGNQQAMSIQSEIASLRSQQYQLSRLNTSGILADDIYNLQTRELDGKLQKLKNELMSVSSTDDTDIFIDKLSFLISVIESEPMQTGFNPALFEQIIEQITVTENYELRFRLHGGIEFTEQIITKKGR